MIEKVAVGTDGSETANKAVDFALDVAEKFGATVVICSSYRPVSEDKVRRDQREAPEDIQWSINPTQEVDATLAGRRAGPGAAASRPSPRPARATRPTCSATSPRSTAPTCWWSGNKGMQRRVLGSVPNSVSHKAPCSVVIVKTT